MASSDPVTSPSTTPTWPPGKPPDPLAYDDIHIWAVPIRATTSRSLAAAWQVLSTAEQDRARRLRAPANQDAFVLHHAALRTLLGSYLACPPASVRFQIETRGKPILAQVPPPLHFNISRSGPLGLLAFTTAGPIGVDLEQVREFPERDGVVNQFFSASEKRGFALVPPERRLSAFFAVWTLKEAAAKATGEGAAVLPFIETDVSRPEAPAFRRLDRHPDAALFSTTLTPAAGWVGHVVADGRPVNRVRLHRWDLSPLD